MSIYVKLDRSVLWHPGDVVNGTVIFKCTEQTDVRNIRVEFEGRLRVRETRSRGQNGSVTYKGKVDLFRQGIILFQGPFTLPPTTKEWPFQFQLPLDCSQATPKSMQDRSRIGFLPDPMMARFMNLETSQTLPPTMSDGDTGVFSSRKECYISYHVTATWEPDSFFKGTRVNHAPLNVEPYRDESQREPRIGMYPWSQDFFIKSYFLDPDYQNRALTFKEKMKSTFNSKEIPETIFKLNVQAPDTMLSGQRLPVFIGISAAKEAEGKKEPPEVLLRSYKAILTKKVFQMTHRGEGIFAQNDHVATFDDDMTFESWDGSEPLGGGIDVRALHNVRSPGFTIAPSFRSLIISRMYSLRIVGEVECAQQRKRFTTPMKHINILFRECSQMGGGAPRVVSQVPAYDAPGADAPPAEPLPSYKAAINAT